MYIERVDFENLNNPPPAFERWKIRLVLHGDGFESRAMPMAVQVGEQNVEMLMPWFLEGSIGGMQGFLVERPQAGEVVRIGYVDGPLHDTEFQFSDDLMVA